MMKGILKSNSQKRISILLAIFCCLQLEVPAQLNQRNWLMGGTASYASHSNEGIKARGLTISPKIGYFVIDKFATGAALDYNHDVSIAFGLKSRTAYFAIGPFLRYYLLNPDNQINILGEVRYQFGIDKWSGSTSDRKSHEFSAMAGPVFFLNSSVALELLIEYSRRKVADNFKQRDITIGVGLQFHLERDN